MPFFRYDVLFRNSRFLWSALYSGIHRCDSTAIVATTWCTNSRYLLKTVLTLYPCLPRRERVMAGRGHPSPITYYYACFAEIEFLLLHASHINLSNTTTSTAPPPPVNPRQTHASVQHPRAKSKKSCELLRITLFCRRRLLLYAYLFISYVIIIIVIVLFVLRFLFHRRCCRAHRRRYRNIKRRR